jgi:hypothetical protein
MAGELPVLMALNLKKIEFKIVRNIYAVVRICIQDTGSSVPGSETEKNPDLGSNINIPDKIAESLGKNFSLKTL